MVEELWGLLGPRFAVVEAIALGWGDPRVQWGQGQGGRKRVPLTGNLSTNLPGALPVKELAGFTVFFIAY